MTITKDVQTEARWWQAVLERDSRFDDRFVYAVRSTGIYCRPSCSARRPRRDRVCFFGEPSAAEREGYRECRRCRAKSPRGAGAGKPLVDRALRAIATNPDGPLTLEELSARAGTSPHRLLRTFKQIVGVSPRRYQDALRLDRLKTKLRLGQAVTASLYEAGYGSSSRLYERAPERMGMTPATYRRGGTGVRIRYATADTCLGRLLVARTERGICSVSIADSDAVLEARLEREFPLARRDRDRAGLERWVRTIVRHLDGKEPRLDLPLDVRGTAFQLRVWEELRRIPYGETRSYAEVARLLGRPRAARAVARACATNPVSLVTPCHRVVRGNGELGGFGLGIERKRALLAREREDSR